MAQFLRGLVRNLEGRCSLLRDRLAALQVDPEVQTHLLDAYQRVERVRREAEQTLKDPTLGADAFLSNHLRSLRELERRVTLVESYLLPFVERYAESDRRLTRLCRRLIDQVSLPLHAPLVVAFSNHYYWTIPPFPLVCAPAGEVHTLLRLPDLCHELGHQLLEAHRGIVYPFLQDLLDYIDREKRRATTAQRPAEYQVLYDQLLMEWRDRWLWEFGADMVATYLCGPSYGWQHVRLCTEIGKDAYHPTLGEQADHPADEARLRGLMAILHRMGAKQAGASIETVGHGYVSPPGSSPSGDYALAYPQSLIDALNSPAPVMLHA